VEEGEGKESEGGGGDRRSRVRKKGRPAGDLASGFSNVELGGIWPE
jgi:hypothetical protein